MDILQQQLNHNSLVVQHIDLCLHQLHYCCYTQTCECIHTHYLRDQITITFIKYLCSLPSKSQPLVSMSQREGIICRWLTRATVYPSQGVWHHAEDCMTEEGDGSIMIKPLGAPSSTPLYLCLPPVQGSVSGDCYFPTKRGHTWRSLVKINPLSTRTPSYRDMCTVLLRIGPVMLVDHPRELASPANQRKLCKNRGKEVAKCETLTNRGNPPESQYIWHTDAANNSKPVEAVGLHLTRPNFPQLLTGCL